MDDVSRVNFQFHENVNEPMTELRVFDTWYIELYGGGRIPCCSSLSVPIMVNDRLDLLIWVLKRFLVSLSMLQSILQESGRRYSGMLSPKNAIKLFSEALSVRQVDQSLRIVEERKKRNQGGSQDIC